MQILDGKQVAAKVRDQVQQNTAAYFSKTQRRPGLAVVLVGEDPASQVYVGSKIKACAEVGIASFEHRLAAGTTQAALEKVVKDLNADPQVHGILVQLPLPKGLDEARVIAAIDPRKDVDGLTAESAGRLLQNRQVISPCTPAGVMEILRHYQIPTGGRRAVVVGRSAIVGLPMAQLLTQANATVTIAHSKTQDLRALTREADLVVVAAGKPRLLGKEDFKAGAVVVDVGIHRLNGKKLCGDVRGEELTHVAALTPVPGGVGPMTIAMLMKNTWELFQQGEKNVGR